MNELFHIISMQIQILLRTPWIILTEKNLLKISTQIGILLSRLNTIFNFMSIFILNKTTLICGRVPSWINKKIEGLFLEENLYVKKYFNKNNSEF